ncbi:MAG: L,D-transpeptidase [Gammaproteobacteria bacterium]|nr:L,D-transpeptidase [Gammaproteobacteria bacterium]
MKPEAVIRTHRRIGQMAEGLGVACGTSGFILIELKHQCLHLLHQSGDALSWPISSSRYGVGCAEGSYKTPIGLHRVAEKIGNHLMPGEILRGRVPQGQVAVIHTGPKASPTDLICSRILWLQGLEEGVNAGAGCDSYTRYIYIHGTADEGLVGQPASIGCIRMRNADVIKLFDQVAEGTLVFIETI